MVEGEGECDKITIEKGGDNGLFITLPSPQSFNNIVFLFVGLTTFEDF